MSKYTIFGGGPSGLYTAWRLLSSDKLTPSDTLELLEWGNYDYNADGNGSRMPAGRICSSHYNNDINQSYIEVGGMRYIKWDNSTKSGHQLVTITIDKLGLTQYSIPFNTTSNPLLYLRNKNLYQNDINVNNPAPYDTPYNTEPSDELISKVSMGLIGDSLDRPESARVKQCRFYTEGALSDSFESSVYQSEDWISGMGYWNVLYDQVLNEGYSYAEDAGGYTSNVINWNAANAAIYNSEFAPGGSFKTLSKGFSHIFVTMYQKCEQLAKNKNLSFNLRKKTRLHSIWTQDDKIQYYQASATNPYQPDGDIQSSDYAFLAMPPHAVELVAQATRYQVAQAGRMDFLNKHSVANYLDSVIQQPSFKVAMFFNTEWWKDPSVTYPPKLNPKDNNNEVNVFGPTITDLPIRQVYYFGNNARDTSTKPVYGILASYDDMRFTKFWQGMDIPVDVYREMPLSHSDQPLQGARTATNTMTNMLLLQLALIHYNDSEKVDKIPRPLQTMFMDWGLNPFGAGYHAWASHYNLSDVMQSIRTPARMVNGNPNIFLVGSAFSNDQAWIEGAFCTAESVLVEYLGLSTIAEDTINYPLICNHCC